MPPSPEQRRAGTIPSRSSPLPPSASIRGRSVILTLIRHGETTANLARLLQGVADSPLTVFGQAQVEALAKAFASTLKPPDSKAPGSTLGLARSPTTTLDLPPPTLIACSPVGRARKTAEAIYKACSGAGATEALEADPSVLRAARVERYSGEGQLRLLVDPGLAERDFGPFESTRNRVHVPGFEKGKGKGEDKLAFRNRVHKVGRDWLEAAASLARQVEEEEEENEENGHRGVAGEGDLPRQKEPPLHIVLVSHGMWIANFLSLHPPTSIAQVSGQPTHLPFAANTGIFSLSVEPIGAEGTGVASSSFRTTLVKANDTRHLAHVKRQRGGIGRVAHDEKQTKLHGFFAPSSKRRKVSEEGQASGS